MILALYEEVEDLARKQQHLGGEYHFMDTIQSNDCVWFILKKYYAKNQPLQTIANSYKVLKIWQSVFYLQIGREKILRGA